MAKLAIPPAWSDVWISPHPNGPAQHLAATTEIANIIAIIPVGAAFALMQNIRAGRRHPKLFVLRLASVRWRRLWIACRGSAIDSSGRYDRSNRRLYI
ncbi:hypothetical protein [Mesorhizobium montanum]|uniref:hypothetical protein n=1 Tax=Mesorhizobium montanum TaxID=3072323 RepID=UPI003222176C